MFGCEAIRDADYDGGDVAHEEPGPASVVGGAAHCEAAAMVVDDDGVSLALLDLAAVARWDVEGEFEGRGAGAVEGGGGEGAEEGGRWGGGLREGVQPEADAGEGSPDAGLEGEESS